MDENRDGSVEGFREGAAGVRCPGGLPTHLDEAAGDLLGERSARVSQSASVPGSSYQSPRSLIHFSLPAAPAGSRSRSATTTSSFCSQKA
jgi:hypothetical protein